MKISYELTMPNNNSWNGKWSGERNKYYVIKTYLGQDAKIIEDLFIRHSGMPSFYYNFGDGWGARVSLQKVDAKESNKRKKVSKGFSGYEWMIDEIKTHGYILGIEERRIMRETKKQIIL